MEAKAQSHWATEPGSRPILGSARNEGGQGRVTVMWGGVGPRQIATVHCRSQGGQGVRWEPGWSDHRGGSVLHTLLQPGLCGLQRAALN